MSRCPVVVVVITWKKCGPFYIEGKLWEDADECVCWREDVIIRSIYFVHKVLNFIIYSCMVLNRPVVERRKLKKLAKTTCIPSFKLTIASPRKQKTNIATAITPDIDSHAQLLPAPWIIDGTRLFALHGPKNRPLCMRGLLFLKALQTVVLFIEMLLAL